MKAILITGASSGLGAALALEYAAHGVLLHLGGRDEGRLAEVAQQVEKRGAKAMTRVVDVTDRAAMEGWITQANAIKDSPLEIVIANAGISAGTGSGEESDAQCAEIFATNLHGVLNTVQPVIPLLKKRGWGQIVIMSSLAGFRGIPGAPSYAASKAAVRIYGESLRGELARFGVGLTVVCPGFVKTPMTEVNNFPMPFVMTAQQAAKLIKKGITRNAARVAFPWPMAAIVWFLSVLPPAWTDALFSRLPRKE